ncbi:hypothetical protein JMJ77_0012089 [Colletotrichum scovillei]|uniref:Uncharacterized protein n=1 Tax=Colletotrichum scovillei TaxID=1209932 RepID=A0A9P7UAQ2_9PEZI|nr:hypothetical protein JMJ77_0012089 [Colletotrichum scovillei]KAG7046378.1 hypothetical protein JMJ78_0011442 [Colletotrichum scovillei]KAG7063727.1 hypothetical protein JMJ76_0006185 [Colletotrichum scovillei]
MPSVTRKPGGKPTMTLLRYAPNACHRVTPPISPATLTENPTIGVEERSQDPGVYHSLRGQFFNSKKWGP